MPGMNQRGPMNQGPRTGRGRGACAGNNMGGGFGNGFGACGRGGRWGTGAGGGYAPPQSREESLKTRAEILKAELDYINGELGKSDSQE